MDYGPPPLVFPKPAIIRPSSGEALRYGMPREAMLPGMVPIGAAAGRRKRPLDFTHVDDAVDPANLTTYTFSDINFGAAAADRDMIITGTGRGSSATAISSVTIGGVGASLPINHTFRGSTAFVAVARVPSGSTGDVVVTFAGGVLRCGIGAGRATGMASHTPIDTYVSTGSPVFQTDLDVDATGFIVAIAFDTASSSTGWSGIDQNFNYAPGDWESNGSMSGASRQFESAASGHSITHTRASSSGSSGIMVAASFR